MQVLSPTIIIILFFVPQPPSSTVSIQHFGDIPWNAVDMYHRITQVCFGANDCGFPNVKVTTCGIILHTLLHYSTMLLAPGIEIKFFFCSTHDLDWTALLRYS